MFKNYFNFVVPSALAKKLYETMNEKKNNELKKMSEDEKEIEQPDKILTIVEEVLAFNRQQQGQGLKILTPD